MKKNTKFWEMLRKFISFGLIGVVNTAIDLLVYGFSMKILHFDNWVVGEWRPGTFFAGAVAFIVASVFSYFANAILTFKPDKKTTTQFLAVMAVFVVRLLIASALTTLFDFAMYRLVSGYDGEGWLGYVPRFFASALLIPIAFFVLDFVFKKTGTKNDKNQGKDSIGGGNIVK